MNNDGDFERYRVVCTLPTILDLRKQTNKYTCKYSESRWFSEVHIYRLGDRIKVIACVVYSRFSQSQLN